MDVSIIDFSLQLVVNSIISRVELLNYFYKSNFKQFKDIKQLILYLLLECNSQTIRYL